MTCSANWKRKIVGIMNMSTKQKPGKNGIGMKKKVLRNTYTIIAISNSYIHHDSVLFILVYNVKTKNMGWDITPSANHCCAVVINKIHVYIRVGKISATFSPIFHLPLSFLPLHFSPRKKFLIADNLRKLNLTKAWDAPPGYIVNWTSV